MSPSTLPGGSTQDEVMAVALFKLGLRSGDLILDVGCGTGKVSIAAASMVAHVCAIDCRPEAIRYAKKEAGLNRAGNIDFFCTGASEFLAYDDRIFDCAFVGGSKELSEFLPMLAKHVRRRIVVNAVLLDTMQTAVASMRKIGIFCEVVHVQITRSHEVAGSIMFKPIDPVYVIVGKGAAC
jgi:cobalt-precorrin-6B (C15)-methyltransferase